MLTREQGVQDRKCPPSLSLCLFLLQGALLHETRVVLFDAEGPVHCNKWPPGNKLFVKVFSERPY